MSSFLIDKFKGKYRLKAPYDISTNMFPRKPNGDFEDIDVYITCKNKCQIFHYGHSILQFYCPSLSRGRGIVKNIYRDFIRKENTKTEINEYQIIKDGKEIELTKETISVLDQNLFVSDLKDNSNIIFNVEETDNEVQFMFKYYDMDKLENVLYPLTSGANISHFSKKNIKISDYKIPEDELYYYTEIIKKIGNNSMLLVKTYSTEFLKSILSKKQSFEDIKIDMNTKAMKTKEYIHSIGKWQEYIDFLNKKVV